MSGFVRQSLYYWFVSGGEDTTSVPRLSSFSGIIFEFFRKIPLMYSKWSLCFLVANIQFWKCEVKCFGKFFMKENKSYLVQYVSTKNIILRFMLGSQVCGPQVCEPIVIHWILIIYHYKKVIFNTKTKTSMKKKLLKREGVFPFREGIFLFSEGENSFCEDVIKNLIQPPISPFIRSIYKKGPKTAFTSFTNT